jgi:site-specific DNA-methyltransferase (adenine-specific)
MAKRTLSKDDAVRVEALNMTETNEAAAVWVPRASLHAWAQNPRKNDGEPVKKVMESIKRFGFASPIIARTNGEVIAGHTRLKAAEALGLDRVPVRYMDLDPAEAHLLALADNKLNEEAEWDASMLATVLSDFSFDDAALAGWDSDDLDKLADELGANELKEVEEDEVPEPPVEPTTKPGDLWLLGEHRLLCGTSESSDDMAKLMNGETADLLLTDPPYGVSYASKNEFLNAYDKGNCVQREIANDHRTPKEMQEFWFLVLSNAHAVCSNKASYYIFSPQSGDLMMMMMSIERAGWQLKHTLVWVKNNHVLGRCDYHYKHEPVFYGWKQDGTHEFFGSSSCVTTLNFDRPSKSDLHPTMKPVALCAFLMQNNSREGGKVLDLFLGSGTTLIAAEQTNRKCFGMELDPYYCDVIVKRWETLTGKKAELAVA